MQHLTEIVFEKSPLGIFTRPEVACWIGGSDQRQFSLVKRALAKNEVHRVHRGLYCLSGKYLRRKVDPFVLAQRIYGPSYISLETALSYHGWIPEAVYTLTSVCSDRSREFETPFGRFSFTRVPQKTLYMEVSRMENEAGCFFLASPLKALADYVYVHKVNWASARPVIESLRVEETFFSALSVQAFDELEANYGSLRVRRFLKGFRKDVKP